MNKKTKNKIEIPNAAKKGFRIYCAVVITIAMITALSAAALAADIPGAVYLSDIGELPARLSAEARPGDLVVIMGAGDIDRRFAALHAALGLTSTEEEPGGN